MRILFGENLIWRFFTIRQTAKLKSSPNFPAIRYVKRSSTSVLEFVNINSLVSAIITHTELEKLVYPASSIVALYVLTGCDCVSSFYRCTKALFLATLMENFQFVFQQCRSLVSVEDNLIKINVDPWMRLVTIVYYYKHRTFLEENQYASLTKTSPSFPIPLKVREF